MSDVWSDWEAARNRKPLEVNAGGDFNELPLLSQLMSGTLDAAGILWTRPPYKLLLWLEGGQLHFCCTAKEKWPKLWGTSPGLTQGLLGVEKAIAERRCQWKAPEVSNGDLTHKVK